MVIIVDLGRLKFAARIPRHGLKRQLTEQVNLRSCTKEHVFEELIRRHTVLNVFARVNSGDCM